MNCLDWKTSIEYRLHQRKIKEAYKKRVICSMLNVFYYFLLRPIRISWKKLFPLKSEIRQRLILSPVLFNILLKGLLDIIWQEKYTRGIQTGKEETNIISVFRGWCCLRKPKKTLKNIKNYNQ